MLHRLARGDASALLAFEDSAGSWLGEEGEYEEGDDQDSDSEDEGIKIKEEYQGAREGGEAGEGAATTNTGQPGAHFLKRAAAGEQLGLVATTAAVSDAAALAPFLASAQPRAATLSHQARPVSAAFAARFPAFGAGLMDRLVAMEEQVRVCTGMVQIRQLAAAIAKGLPAFGPGPMDRLVAMEEQRGAVDCEKYRSRGVRSRSKCQN